jgi:hypothetical protein
MIATIALLAWPVIALILFMVMSAQRATVWTILGGYLLLPFSVILVDLPGIPELDKSNIPSLAALLQVAERLCHQRAHHRLAVGPVRDPGGQWRADRH